MAYVVSQRLIAGSGDADDVGAIDTASDLCAWSVHENGRCF